MYENQKSECTNSAFVHFSIQLKEEKKKVFSNNQLILIISSSQTKLIDSINWYFASPSIIKSWLMRMHIKFTLNATN